MLSKKDYLVVFAKEPQKGKVKTRLAKDIGEENALKLYQVLLKDTLDIVREVNVSHKILAFESLSKEPGCFKSIAPDFTFYPQQGNTLGERMHRAFEYCKDLGAQKTIIIGSDCPTLSSETVQQAFERLGEDDVIIGPTQDGGYYLIGLKEPQPAIMANIAWSSSGVFEMTLKKAQEDELKVGLLGVGYDIDVIEDLKRLKDEGILERKHAAPGTKKFLSEVSL